MHKYQIKLQEKNIHPTPSIHFMDNEQTSFLNFSSLEFTRASPKF